MAVASTLKVVEIENTRLQEARVAIGGGFSATNDVLSVTTRPGITVAYIATTGVLTLTGNATVATYLAVLKSLKFTATSAAPAGLRAISLTVSDGLLDSHPVTRTVNVV